MKGLVINSNQGMKCKSQIIGSLLSSMSFTSELYVNKLKSAWNITFSSKETAEIRYPKEIMKMEQHFSSLHRWLQK